MSEEESRSLGKLEGTLEQIVVELQRIRVEFQNVDERVVVLERRWNTVYGIGLALTALAGGLAGVAGIGKLFIGVSE